MKCEQNKIHDKLSFTTLKHLTGILDDALKQGGIKSVATRESICAAFIFQSSYFFDNRWVKFNGSRYRVGFCFQEFAKDPFAPSTALVVNYASGEMLHEAAIGITETHFKNDNSVVRSFDEIGEVYEVKGGK